MEIQILRNAIKSINEDFCTKQDFKDEEVFEYNELYYNIEIYVVLHNGEICLREETGFCDYYEEYFDSEEIQEVNIYKDTLYYSEKAINKLCLVDIDGIYYDEDALDYNGYHYLQDLERWSDDGAYWHEREDAFYSYPERSQNFTRGYHNGAHKMKIFDDLAEYKIGYEIEKEDDEILEYIDIEDFEEETDYLWRKEEDGSLNSNGFELVSPTFELDIEKIFELINQNEILKDHINAEYSTNCGGHINLSKNGCNGEEVFNLVCGYTPLLYSLYYGRVDKNYSKGKSNKDLKNDNEKYQAIKIHDNRIEFRIFSAVPNVETLFWRTKLIEKMLQHPTADVRTAYWHIKTKFKTILTQVYNSEKMEILKERIFTNTLKFEGIDLSTKRNNNKK